MTHAKKKPEHMTSLYGDVLVPKTHERIVFRGAIDILEAEVLEAQVLAADCGEPWYHAALGEVLALLRNIMKAEVTDSALAEFTLFGLDEAELHRQSHAIKKTFGIDVPLPDSSMGPLAIRLNYLRARAREVEILAIKTFAEGISPGYGIITALNRLSSAFWWLFCGFLARHNVQGKSNASPTVIAPCARI